MYLKVTQYIWGKGLSANDAVETLIIFRISCYTLSALLFVWNVHKLLKE